jgi:gliding motility-associated transport system ATP-binding protein
VLERPGNTWGSRVWLSLTGKWGLKTPLLTTCFPHSPTYLPPMITVQDLTRKYAHTTAVDHISFSVDKGQIVGFLGPNGAGKTTTMRMLTCFLPPTSGTASVAGFDVLEQSLEVRRRIGYLPETPPLYPEMETAEYLRFVGRLKGLRGAELEKRVDYVCGRCAVADVKKKLLGKLSKGYRQRVGLAQAILHNPDVLILDEPTAGLDPKQINETRDLIKDLAGEHTIILSTHILPEVEQTCEHVIIINRGRVVATDSVANLQGRARDAEIVVLEVAGRGAPLDPADVQQRLERVAGVSRVQIKNQFDSRAVFETESRRGELTRGDLARAVIESGWDLNELRPAAMSLEEIFLQLTGSDSAAQPAASEPPQEAAGAEAAAEPHAAAEEPQASEEPQS